MANPVSLRMEDLADSPAMRTLLDQSLTTLRHDLPALGSVYEPRVREAIWTALLNKVDFDLFDWLAEAWAAVAEVQRLKHEPGPVTQDLKTSPVTGKLHPVITIRIGATSLELPFTVAITAAFALVELTVAAGFITKIASGHCKVSAQVSCRDMPLGNALELKTFALPFVHTLKKPGLRILR